MKYIALIAGILLGLLFVFASLSYFFHLVSAPVPAPGSSEATFFAAMVPTGYFDFVKTFELLGGITIAIPITRRLGLLILGPIALNILAFHIFIEHGHGLLEVPLIAMVVLLLFLLWVESQAFIALAIK